MELRVDPASPVPMYAQVVEQIRTLVALRALRPGDRLPSALGEELSLLDQRLKSAKSGSVI